MKLQLKITVRLHDVVREKVSWYETLILIWIDIGSQIVIIVVVFHSGVSVETVD